MVVHLLCCLVLQGVLVCFGFLVVVVQCCDHMMATRYCRSWLIVELDDGPVMTGWWSCEIGTLWWSGETATYLWWWSCDTAILFVVMVLWNRYMCCYLLCWWSCEAGICLCWWSCETGTCGCWWSCETGICGFDGLVRQECQCVWYRCAGGCSTRFFLVTLCSSFWG